MLPPGLNHLLYWFPKKRVKRGQSRVQKSVQSNWRFLHQLNSVSPKRYDADNENLYGNHLAFMMFHSPSFNEKETNSGYNRSVSLLVLWNLLAKTTKSWISLSARYFTKEKRHRLTFNRWGGILRTRSLKHFLRNRACELFEYDSFARNAGANGFL